MLKLFYLHSRNGELLHCRGDWTPLRRQQKGRYKARSVVQVTPGTRFVLFCFQFCLSSLWTLLHTVLSTVLSTRLVGLYKVRTVQQSSCTGLPCVQVQWTKCPKTVRQRGESVQEIWCTRLLVDSLNWRDIFSAVSIFACHLSVHCCKLYI